MNRFIMVSSLQRVQKQPNLNICNLSQLLERHNNIIRMFYFGSRNSAGVGVDLGKNVTRLAGICSSICLQQHLRSLDILLKCCALVK